MSEWVAWLGGGGGVHLILLLAALVIGLVAVTR